MSLKEKSRPLQKETIKFTGRFRNSANYNELISMFQALSLEDKTVLEAYNAMETDEVEGDGNREKDCEIQATFDPMDIDQEAEAYINIEHYNGSSVGLRPVQTIKDTLTFHHHYDTKLKDSSENALAVQSSYEFPSLINLHESQPEEFPVDESGTTHNKNLRRLTYLTHRLAGHDPIRTFTDNCKKTMPDWIALLRKTTLPSTIASSDPLITAAFKTVDSIFLRQESPYLLRRLAYFQLMRLFEYLEAIIGSERKKRVHCASGYGNTSIAIDIYIGAQEWPRQPNLRSKIVEYRRRIGKRIIAMAKPSPFFLLIYSDATEAVLYVSYPIYIQH